MSGASSWESVNGFLRNFNGAQIELDMPLFLYPLESQSALERAEVKVFWR
jgi:hypothetical protein